MNRMLIAIATSACAVAAVTSGCGSDDTPSTTADTGATVTDTGTMETSPMTTLYDRLGKNAGIKAAVDAIVVDELKDPEIAAFFAKNDGMTAGHPSAVQIKECLVLQLGMASGGPEKYPGKVSGDFMCRDMKSAHASIDAISSATFDKFVTIAAGTLKRLGVADADIAVVGGVLNSTKTDIVRSTAADAGPG
jgi:truncated hemoglobin YjbI